MRHQKGQSFYKAVFFLPSVISLVVGSILYTWILNPISGPVRDCWQAGLAETAVLVENGGLGHRGTLHYHDLEDVWLQFHQHSGGSLRCLNGGHRGGASGKCADVEDF